jgi:hypothetical protein
MNKELSERQAEMARIRNEQQKERKMIDKMEYKEFLTR